MKTVSPVWQFHRASALLIVLVFCSVGYSQRSDDFPSRTAIGQTIEELKSDLDSIMDHTSTPGAAVAIVSRDSIVWIGTFGLANIETGEQVTENTHFCIGSCTKSFTGLGFLKLLDEGKVDILTPVREIAPEVEIDNPWADTHPVRIVHLLEHTAGFDDSHPNWFYLDGPKLSLRQALEAKAHLRRVRWQPGTRFSYSSAGFTLAGYVMEKISGRRYEDYLRQAILIPTGMAGTRVGYSQESDDLMAVGYNRDKKPVPDCYDYDVPAGAVFSSIREMAFFVQFLLNRGAVGDTQVISENLFDRVGRPTTTLAARSGLESGYSFGVSTRYDGGAKWYGHSGAVPGFLAEYFYNPDGGLGFVVLQNRFGIYFSSDVFDRVWDYVRSHVDSITSPPSSVPCHQLESYCGYYEPRNPRLQLAGFIEILTGGVTILCENDTLYTQGFMEDKTPLLPISKNLFRRSRHPEATRVFAKTADGGMVYASQGSYYERTSIWKTYVYRILVFAALIIMMSSIAYALTWVPVYIYKMLKHRDDRCRYHSMRLVPLLAVLSLIAGVAKMSDQTMLEFGQLTALNVVFFVSTLVFAVLSALSLFTTYRSFHKPVKMGARVYAVLLSSACFGMTLYLGYWGVIGLRLWTY